VHWATGFSSRQFRIKLGGNGQRIGIDDNHRIQQGPRIINSGDPIKVSLGEFLDVVSSSGVSGLDIRNGDFFQLNGSSILLFGRCFF